MDGSVEAAREIVTGIIDTFRRFSADGDRTIGRAELARTLKALDPGTWSDENFEKLMSAVAVGEDDRVPYETLLEWILTAERQSVPDPVGFASQPRLLSASRSFQKNSILRGYGHARKDLTVVIQCVVADLSFAELLRDAFRAWGLQAEATTERKPSEEEITIWFVTPYWDKALLDRLEGTFNRDKAVLLFPAAMKHSAWIAKLMAEGLPGPTVEIGMKHKALSRAQLDDVDLISYFWTGRLWSKLMKLQGVRAYRNEMELGKAIYAQISGPDASFYHREVSATPDGTPHVVGFVGSTSFFKNWTCQLMRYMAAELLALNRADMNNEIVLCTGGFRNMGARLDETNQGVGYTVSWEFYRLGGHVVHILPEVANEKDFGNLADHLKDGSFLPAEHGQTLFAGKTSDEHLRLQASVCDVIFLVEGGPGAAVQAREALQESGKLITVVPVRASGGAAAGEFGVPPIHRPEYIDAEAWATVADESISPKENVSEDDLRKTARAMARITWCTMYPLSGVDEILTGVDEIQPRGRSGRKSVRTAVEALQTQMLGYVRICILGSTSFKNADSETLVRALAQKLSAALSGSKVVFVTGGMPGVQEVFAKHCVDGTRIWNLVPSDRASDYSAGRDVFAGRDMEQRRQVFGALGDIYITVEGGPGVAQEARAAFARGAHLVPFIRTGGASAGMFEFPEGALEKPAGVQEQHWRLLGRADVPVEQSAEAGAAIVAGAVESLERAHSPQRRQELQVPAWHLSETEFQSPWKVLQTGQLSVFLTMLKLLEKGFRIYGCWSIAQENNLLQILEALHNFLAQFVKRSRTSHHRELMKKAYIAQGSKFRRVYATIVQDVIGGEGAFCDFVSYATEEQSRVAALHKDVQQNASGTGFSLLLQVYREAHQTMLRLDDLCTRVAAKSGTKFVKATLKRMWRSLEKIALKYSLNSDMTQAAAQLKDVARGALQGDMKQLLKALHCIIADEEACLVRIKNRFDEPADMGWADCQVMIYFKNDKSRHICEIQLVHHQLMIVRSSMGAHHEYANVRSAGELLTLYGESLPSLMPAGNLCQSGGAT